MVNWEEELEEVGIRPPWHLVSEWSLSHHQSATWMDVAAGGQGRGGGTSSSRGAMHGLVNNVS